MNNDFNSDLTEKEQDQNEVPLRRPLRRARRTVAPFTQETPVENAEANSESALETEVSDFSVPDITLEKESEDAAVQNSVAEESSEAPTAEEASLTEETAEQNTAEAEESAVSEEDAESNPSEESDENGEDSKDAEIAEEEKLSPIAETFDWIKSFLFSLTVVIFIFTLIFRGVTVNGGSMLPTLENGEYLIISDLLYTPENGDIVVVQSPRYKNATEPLIKRVIATSGQRVKINFNTWEVWVEGELLHEDYILRDGVTTMNCEDMKADENGEVEFKVDEGCIFVMGDHRNDSLDSRSNSVGQIDERYIMGRVVFRLSPIERLGKVD